MPKTAPDAERFRRSSSTVSARVLEETVVLDLDGDRYTRLNGSAGLLWEELAEPRSGAELADRLVAEYGIDSDRARADVEGLLAKLRDGGLLETA
jgi:Coenzyme PQQ synthesis protein D (PqqD)